MDSVRDRVKSIVAMELGVDASRIGDDTLFEDDLGAGPEDRAALINAFEEGFGVEVPRKFEENIVFTFRNAVEIIELLRDQ